MKGVNDRGRGGAARWGDPLIGILLVGVLSLVAVPSVRQVFQSRTYQLERERQRRTMIDIRDLATALESYQVDNSLYPDATCATGLFTVATAAGNLTSASWTRLTPTYIAVPPFQDGWGWQMFYTIDSPHLDYEIASLGRDDAPGTLRCGTTTSFNDDIVFSDGTFIQWPEGP